MGPWSSAKDPERPMKVPRGDEEVAAEESVETTVSSKQLKRDKMLF